MSMTKKMTTWIRLVATEQDRQMLEQISQRNGDAGLSATVRRLIREEAQRLGINNSNINSCNLRASVQDTAECRAGALDEAAQGKGRPGDLPRSRVVLE